MKKVIVLIYILGAFSFCFSAFNRRDILSNITTDFDSSIYLEIGQKEYTKENVYIYYKQVIRYFLYFLYFIDIENLETVVI